MTSRKHFIFLNFSCIKFHSPLFNSLRSLLHASILRTKRPIFLKMLYTVKPIYPQVHLPCIAIRNLNHDNQYYIFYLMANFR